MLTLLLGAFASLREPKGFAVTLVRETVMPVLRSLGSALLDLCLPRTCAGCQRTWMLSEQGFWCPDCRNALAWIESPLCPGCGLPFLDSPESTDHLCGDCLKNSFAFDAARSAVLYAGVARERIHQLKFGGKLHWVPALVDLVMPVSHPGAGIAQVDMILPVPLHKERLRQRGFNQAGLIAAQLGRRLSIPVGFGVLIRHRATLPQTRLGRRERLHNVKGAFAVVRSAAVRERSVLLVDDVFTTGTTLSECARALKRAGAQAVYALTVARVVPDAAVSGFNDDSGGRS
jgi:ComF family protein